MKICGRLLLLLLLLGATAKGDDGARVLKEVTPLPVSLDKDFQFRKTKLFALGVRTEDLILDTAQKGKKRAPGGGGSRVNAVVAEASINFEGRYRNFGAVTNLDQHERNGNYFDFFWRARRDADLTVRLEYRQERLRSFVQAREIQVRHARGHHRTEFAVIGDDFFDDGSVIAWRCLLIENGHIVAENRSYLWR